MSSSFVSLRKLNAELTEFSTQSTPLGTIIDATELNNTGVKTLEGKVVNDDSVALSTSNSGTLTVNGLFEDPFSSGNQLKVSIVNADNAGALTIDNTATGEFVANGTIFNYSTNALTLNNSGIMTVTGIDHEDHRRGALLNSGDNANLVLINGTVNGTAPTAGDYSAVMTFNGAIINQDGGNLTITNYADGKFIVNGSVIEAAIPGIQNLYVSVGSVNGHAVTLTNSGLMNLNGTVWNNSANDLTIENTGVMTIDGTMAGQNGYAILNVGSGEILINGEMNLTVTGSIVNRGQGAITLNNYLAILGTVYGQEIYLNGTGTVNGHVIGNITTSDTSLTQNIIQILGGTVGTTADRAIIAGAAGVDSSLSFQGNTQLLISGDTTIYGDIYGGGFNHDVEGTVSVTLGTGTMAPDPVLPPEPNPDPEFIPGAPEPESAAPAISLFDSGEGNNVTTVIGDVTGGGSGKNVNKSITLNLNGTTSNPVKVTGNLYGGAKNGNVYGDITFNMSGTPTTAWLAKAQDGDTLGNLYGGGLNCDVGRSGDSRQINLTINGGRIDGDIYLGSNGGLVYGDATLTLKGLDSNFTFTGTIRNDGVQGASKVVFSAYTGNFNGSISALSELSFVSRSSVTIGDNRKLGTVSNLTFNLGSITTPGAANLILTDRVNAPGAINNIAVTLSSQTMANGDYILVDGGADWMTGFDGKDISIYNSNSVLLRTVKVNRDGIDNYVTDNSKDIYAYTTDDGKLCLSVENTGCGGLKWPTNYWTRTAPARAATYTTNGNVSLGASPAYRYVDSTGTTSVKANITTGASGTVYGGSTANLTGSTWLNVTNCSALTIYGGANGKNVAKDSNIYLYKGTSTTPAAATIYGGGKGVATVANTYITIEGGTISGNIYGGGSGTGSTVTGTSNIFFGGAGSALTFTGMVDGEGSTGAVVTGQRNLTFGTTDDKSPGTPNPFSGTFNGNFQNMDQTTVLSASNVQFGTGTGTGTTFTSDNWLIQGTLNTSEKTVTSTSKTVLNFNIAGTGNLTASAANTTQALTTFSVTNAGTTNLTGTDTNGRFLASGSAAVSNTGTGTLTLNGRLVSAASSAITPVSVSNTSTSSGGLTLNGTRDDTSRRTVAIASQSTNAASALTVTNGAVGNTGAKMTINGAIYALSAAQFNVTNYGTLRVLSADTDGTVRSALNSIGSGGVNVDNYGTLETDYIRNEWLTSDTPPTAGNMKLNNHQGTMTVHARKIMAADSAFYPLTGTALTEVMAVLTGQLVASDNIGTGATQTITNAANATFTAEGALVNAQSTLLTISNAGTMNLGSQLTTPPTNAAGYYNSLYNYGTSGGIQVSNEAAGTLSLYGNVRNDGNGVISITSAEAGTLEIKGSIRNLGSGTITITNYDLITGDIDGKDIELSGSGTVEGNIRGGSIDAADANATTEVSISGGTVGDLQKIIAGLIGLSILGKTRIDISNTTTVNSTVFGGGQNVTVGGVATVNIGVVAGSAITLKSKVYGGGSGTNNTGLDAKVGGVAMTLGSGTTTTTAIFGGGSNAQVGTGTGTAVTLNVTGGSYQYLYGGGENLTGTGNADVKGDTNITVTGGSFIRLYGAGYHSSVAGNTHLTIGNGTDIVNITGGACFGAGYGNSNLSGTAYITLNSNATLGKNTFSGGYAENGHIQNITSTNATVNGATINGLLYGGSICTGNGQSTITNALITVNYGTINNFISGGGSASGIGAVSLIKNSTIDLNNGQFNSYIYGGGCATIGTAHVNISTINIKNGIFKHLIYGGAYSNGGSSIVDSANINISGGSFFNSVVGGGGGNTPENSINTTTGSVQITINTDVNIVNWNNTSIYGGGNQRATVSGNTTITFTGLGNNLVGLQKVWGDGLTTGSVKGNKKLVFNNFNGNFSSIIGAFNTVSLTGGTAVALTGSQNLTSVNEWQLTADSTPTSALLDWGAGCTNNFSGDKFSLDITAIASQAKDYTQTLMQGAKAIFDNWHSASSVTIGGVGTLWDATLNGWKTTDLKWAVAVQELTPGVSSGDYLMNVIKLAA